MLIFKYNFKYIVLLILIFSIVYFISNKRFNNNEILMISLIAAISSYILDYYIFDNQEAFHSQCVDKDGVPDICGLDSESSKKNIPQIQCEKDNHCGPYKEGPVANVGSNNFESRLDALFSDNGLYDNLVNMSSTDITSNDQYTNLLNAFTNFANTNNTLVKDIYTYDLLNGSNNHYVIPDKYKNKIKIKNSSDDYINPKITDIMKALKKYKNANIGYISNLTTAYG